ncbi:MAG: universal stress protein [Proteobacteria bacterium]|nr:universal stress protein [Pseudomonadota bacterium]MBU4382128.1 universal stress protein [Pseudomonadota bacterium]MBU4604953.1 universal stress protein [Pseudomonadota bacterium]MCG2763004.1 universal stress protein [Desulfarculaceae bacterium]
MQADKIEIKKVMAAIDLSKYSEDTFLHALTLARALKAELTLVNVINTRYLDSLEQYGGAGLGLDRNEIIQRTINDRQELIEKEYISRSQGVDTQLLFKEGLPWEEIIHAVKETGADMLVVGSKGRGDVAGVLFGSAAEKLQRHAPCPVLTVRGPEHMRAAK